MTKLEYLNLIWAVHIRKLQILNETAEEMLQLDLLNFVSDKMGITASPAKTKRPKAHLGSQREHFEDHLSVMPISAPAPRSLGDIDQNKTFSTFCLEESNQCAVEAAKNFLHSKKSNFGVLYLMASSGQGKSHLLHAIANQLCFQKKSFYISSPLMMSNLDESFTQLKTFDVLLIDDFEEISKSSELQKIFCQLLDYAQMGRLKMVITSSHLPNDLNGCLDRLKGKLSAALIHKISQMDKKLSREIIKSKCRLLNLTLPDPAIDELSHRLNSNGYGLEGILYKLKSVSEIKKQDVHFEMVLEELKSLELFSSPGDQFQAVVTRVAHQFQIKCEELLSPLKRKDVVLARHVAMFILKEKIGLNFMEIADLFDRDHSSVIYAVSRIKMEMESDLATRNTVLNLTRNF